MAAWMLSEGSAPGAQIFVAAISPRMPVLQIEYSERYGLRRRTALTSVSHGPVVADGDAHHRAAVGARSPNLLGASKCGSRRRYAFTLELKIRQISAHGSESDRESSSRRWRAVPLPFRPEQVGSCPWDRDIGVHAASVHPTTGLGSKEAVKPMCWRSAG